MLAQIRKAEIADQSIVREYLQDCLKELSAFGEVEQTYAYFDNYWIEPTRRPYVIEVDGGPIGFIFVNQCSPSGRGTDYAVAEFYVARRWRGQGLGMQAARQVFQEHPGQWELHFFNANATAQSFWPAAIMKAGAASYERVAGPDTTILRFRIAARGVPSK